MILQEIVNIKPSEIDLSAIDIGEGPYTMSYGFDLTDLEKSISEIGLIHPPILVTNSAGRMDIVAGYRRISALRSLGKKRLFYLDLTNKGISSFDMLLLNLHDNLIVRKLNAVEIGMAIKRLSFHISMDTIKKNYVHLFGLKKKQELDTCLRLEKTNKLLKDALSKQEISFKTAMILLDKDTNTRIKILQLIASLNINSNYQLQLIDILDDLSIRDNLSISEILDTADCRQILDNDRLNRPQKVKKIFKYLRSLRYPHLIKSEETFRKMIAGLHLPKIVNVNHSPFFESEDYRMEILFKNGKELYETLTLLTKIKGLKNIKDPWK